MEEQRNNQVVQPITEQTLPNQLTPVSVQQQTPPQVIAPDTIPPKKKSKLWLWIILVALLILLGVGGWWLYNRITLVAIDDCCPREEVEDISLDIPEGYQLFDSKLAEVDNRDLRFELSFYYPENFIFDSLSKTTIELISDQEKDLAVHLVYLDNIEEFDSIITKSFDDSGAIIGQEDIHLVYNGEEGVYLSYAELEKGIIFLILSGYSDDETVVINIARTFFNSVKIDDDFRPEHNNSNDYLVAHNQAKLSQLIPTMIICLDDEEVISKPITGNSVCTSLETVWPELAGEYLWSDVFSSDFITGYWDYCAYHSVFPDVQCDHTGCKKSECAESLVDSDNDGLSDKNEINLYQTDPNNPDTDSDGYLDGEEVNNGYNPLGDGLLNASEIIANETGQVILDNLSYLIKHDDTSFIKFNFFDVPSLEGKLGSSDSFPLSDGFFSEMNISDQVGNVGLSTMMHVKEHVDFIDSYNNLFSQYGGDGGDGGIGGIKLNSYYPFGMFIMWPNEDSVCDFEQGESAIRQGLITSDGDVYFLGAACVDEDHQILKGTGYTWLPQIWEE
jgi:hypothetical protein